MIDGADRLREGAKVTVRNGAPPGAAGAARTPGADHANPPPAAQGADQTQPDQSGEHKHKGHRDPDPSAPAANPP